MVKEFVTAVDLHKQLTLNKGDYLTLENMGGPHPNR